MLTKSGNNRRGSFTVYRLTSDRPLLVDLNLLTSEFSGALAEAVERIMGLSEMSERRLKRAAGNQLAVTTLQGRESRVVNFG